jgi:hypothetical protein
LTAHNRTEITVETERVLIVWERRTVRAWGQECEGPEEAEAPSQGEATEPRATSETRFKSDEK